MMIIEKLSNYFGNGYAIQIEGFGRYKYYGYSLRKAIQLYRRHTGNVYKHFEKIFI